VHFFVCFFGCTREFFGGLLLVNAFKTSFSLEEKSDNTNHTLTLSLCSLSLFSLK
jgi:hypothetical protein